MSRFSIIMLSVILIAAGLITFIFDHNMPAAIMLAAMGVGALIFFLKSS